MGYTLKIGELESYASDEGLESRIINNVQYQKNENAPAFGEPTDHENSRWPSYTSWSKSMHFIGLSDLFFDKENQPSVVAVYCLVLNNISCYYFYSTDYDRLLFLNF